MPHFTAVIETPHAIEEVFDRLADFSSAEEWDPGTVRARRLDDGPVAVGSRFELTVTFLGRESTLVYELVELRRPNRIVLVGQNRFARSLDTITLARLDGATRVTYDAELTLKGLASPFHVLLGPVFDRLGREAADGLREALDGELVGTG